jgi:hypothetical protein
MVKYYDTIHVSHLQELQPHTRTFTYDKIQIHNMLMLDQHAIILSFLHYLFIYS